MSKGASRSLVQLRWRLLQPLLEKSGVIAVVFRGWERRIAQGHGGDFADEHPMPPPELLVAVAGTPNREWFSASGREDAHRLAGLAAQHGVCVTDRCVVLDFGCGCGRLARWMAPQVIDGGGRFLGSDLNPRLVTWCAENLPGEYARNGLQPPLAWEDGVADVVYAYSVMTHLRERTAVRWLSEIARVLRSGGLALLTFHDEAYAGIFGPTEVRATLGEQTYVVFNDALEGSNYISAWTTRRHFADLASRHFEVLEIIPGKDDRSQALALLRRR